MIYQMRSRSKLLQPLLPKPRLRPGPDMADVDEDDSDAEEDDDDVNDAFDFLPNRAKLAFTKVDETIQMVPPLLPKSSNGRPGEQK